MVALEIELESRFEFVFEQPAECSQKHPLEMSSEGPRDPARGSTLRDPVDTPKMTTCSNKQKNHRAVGDSLEKNRVGPIVDHSPSPLKLPPLIP